MWDRCPWWFECLHVQRWSAMSWGQHLLRPTWLSRCGGGRALLHHEGSHAFSICASAFHSPMTGRVLRRQRHNPLHDRALTILWNDLRMGYPLRRSPFLVVPMCAPSPVICVLFRLMWTTFWSKSISFQRSPMTSPRLIPISISKAIRQRSSSGRAENILRRDSIIYHHRSGRFLRAVCRGALAALLP